MLPSSPFTLTSSSPSPIAAKAKSSQHGQRTPVPELHSPRTPKPPHRAQPRQLMSSSVRSDSSDSRVHHPRPIAPLTFDKITTPSAGHSYPHQRRRGRQATACTECNRRKQKCDGQLPCHHCAKRNVGQQCRFPELKSTPRTGKSQYVVSPEPEKGSSGDTIPSFSSKKRKSSMSTEDSPPSKHPSHASFLSSDDEIGSSAHSSPRDTHIPSQTPDMSATLAHVAPAQGPVPFVPHSAHPISSVRHQLVTPPDNVFEGRSRTWWQNTGGSAPPPLQEEPQEYFKSEPQHAHMDSHPSSHTGTMHQDGVLMQESGAPGIGSLAVEGAGDEHGRQFQFYGTSHFGPRLAAQVMHGGNATPDFSDSQYGLPRRSRGSEEDSLAYQIRQLDGALPKRSLCLRFVNAFFELNNSWIDILYEPDFRRKYDQFWEVRGEFEDLTLIDLRWFALFHTVLAFGAVLEKSPDEAHESMIEREELSHKFFVHARRALSEAPSFYGESIDTVRAYLLLSLYLVQMRRIPESWHMVGSAVRAAQAQGFHVDGSAWQLPAKEAELRRRLWAHLYILDRSISYFLGRPLAIQDTEFTVAMPSNVSDDELATMPHEPRPLTMVTKSTFLILHYDLCKIIGQMKTICFGIARRKHDNVMRCEELLLEWGSALPPAFNLDNPDRSWDETHPWLRQQRHTLMSKFNQARITLHRPYLRWTHLPQDRHLLEGYRQSRTACVLSAGAELSLRLSLYQTDSQPFDRLKWMTVASGFSPACVLGILLAHNQRDREFDYAAIRQQLVGYLAIEKQTSRRDHSLDTEIRVLEMLLAQGDEIDARREQARPHASGNASANASPRRSPPPVGEGGEAHVPHGVPPTPMTYQTQQCATFPNQHYSYPPQEQGMGHPRFPVDHGRVPMVIPPEHMNSSFMAPLSTHHEAPPNFALHQSSGSTDGHSHNHSHSSLQSFEPPNGHMNGHMAHPHEVPTMTTITPTLVPPPPHTNSHVTNAAGEQLTLAPNVFLPPPLPGYMDQGEEWLHAAASAPWVPRPPTDPSAGVFPSTDNMPAWNALLSDLIKPADQPLWWGDESGDAE